MAPGTIDAMQVVHAPIHADHDPGHEVQAGRIVPALEIPARADAILAALRAEPRHRIVPPTPFGDAPLAAVHDPGLLAWLARAWEGWVAAGHPGPLIPDTFPLTRYHARMPEAERPDGAIGAAGYWVFDTMSAIGAGTWPAARAAADVALTAAEAVLAGAPAAYGLCRPPGHHAARAMAGGYCYLNNAAIVAEHLVARGAGRVGILDVDYHHGNGTQQIFWERADVPYLSLHADPHRAYPYFSGFPGETGGGTGAGATRNIPLPAGTDDDAYLDALDTGLDWLAGRHDGIVVVSLGIDTYRADPIGDLGLTTDGYRRIGARVAATGARLVILQEGGYHVGDLGRNVAAWLDGAELGAAG